MTDGGVSRAPDGNLLGFMEQALAGFGQDAADLQDAQSDPLEDAPEAHLGETPATPDASASAPNPSALAPDQGGRAPVPREPAADPEQAGTLDPTALLAGYTPATFNADGAPHEVPGILVHPDHGAIVDAEAVPRLLERLGQAEHYERANRELYQQHQALERATTWTHTGPDGQEQRLTGMAALEAARVAYAQSQAALQVVIGAIRNPQIGAGLFAVDGENRIVLNPQAVQHLITESKLAELQAEQRVRQEFQARTAATAAPTVDFQAHGPAYLEAAMQFAGVPTLAPEAKADLLAALPNFVRPATPDDLSKNAALRPGELVIDPRFHALIKRMAATAPVPAPRAPTPAERANAARLAAARTPTPPVRQGQQARAQKQQSDNFFDYQEAAASGRFNGPSDGS